MWKSVDCEGNGLEGGHGWGIPFYSFTRGVGIGK